MNAVTTDDKRIEALAAMAALRGYPFTERLPLWQDRLARNCDEITALQRAKAPATGPYRPVPCRLIEALTPLGEAFGGVANALALGEVSPLNRLHEAVRRARERSDLNAFVTVAGGLGLGVPRLPASSRARLPG